MRLRNLLNWQKNIYVVKIKTSKCGFVYNCWSLFAHIVQNEAI